MKANYAPPDSLTVHWTDGGFVAQPRPEGVFAGMHARNAERAFLEQLAAVTKEGRSASDSVNASNYAPRLFARRPGREGCNRADFSRAMERLFVDGRIKAVSYGRPGDTRRQIVRVETEGENQ